RSSPCRAPKPSAPGFRFPAHASIARTRIHPAQAALHPTGPCPAAHAATPPVRPPRSPPRLFDTWPPALSAVHISPHVHHPRSRSSSWLFPYLVAFLLPSTGRVTLNDVPLPSLAGLCQLTSPPNSATRLATIANPSPVP